MGSLAMLAQEENMPTRCLGAVLCVTTRISNTGDVPGVEIAQLYLGFPVGTGEPPKVLRGFQRLAELAPGASADITFPLTERDLQVFAPEANGWVMPDGGFRIFVGASSRDDRLTSSFAVCKGSVSLEAQPCKS